MYIDEKRLSCINNGKKGGRPKQDSNIRIELPDIELVILTPNQYGSLLEKYGYDLLRKSLLILDKWLKSGSKPSEKYVGKNNYAHFRTDGWLINEAKHFFNKGRTSATHVDIWSDDNRMTTSLE